MKPILYISEAIPRFSQLQAVVDGACLVQQMRPSEVDEIQSFSAVIWDSDRGGSTDSKTLCRLEIECALNAIPLLFVRQADGRQSTGAGASSNMANILSLPFNRQSIIGTIEKQLRDSKELIQTVFVDHLLAATSKVLKVISNTKASCIDINDGCRFRWPAELTGFMSLAGAVEGAVAISFPYELAAAVAVGMTGCEQGDLTDSDIDDVSDEIVNQIAGHARTELWLPEFQFEIALPLIINNIRAVPYENNHGWTMASLLSGDLTFYLQVFIKEVHPSPAAATGQQPNVRPLCPVAD